MIPTLPYRTVFAFAACLWVIAWSAPLIAGSSPGKPNAGLAINSASHYQLDVGRVQAITLALSSESDQGLLRVAVAASSEELEVLSSPHYQFDLTGQELQLTVELLPQVEGRYYLMLSAEVERGQGPAQASVQTQVLGVIVQVGEPTPAAQRKTEPAAVVPLRARETIRRYE